MSRYDANDDHQPLLYLQGHGFYATHVIVAVYVLSMIATAVLTGLGVDAWLYWLLFLSECVLAGEFWRVLTHGLVNLPSIPFAINMVMTVWFGREVEKHLGRRSFLKLYGGIYLLPPMIFTLVGLWQPIAFGGQTGSLALFIAFATLYPGAELFFNLLAKWIALILVAIYVLAALANRDLVGLINLAATCGFAWLYILHAQDRFTLPSLRLTRTLARQANDGKARAPGGTNASAPSRDFMADADALLDKIAREGIDSLTDDERRRLDAARERLRQRQSG